MSRGWGTRYWEKLSLHQRDGRNEARSVPDFVHKSFFHLWKRFSKSWKFDLLHSGTVFRELENEILNYFWFSQTWKSGF